MDLKFVRFKQEHKVQIGIFADDTNIITLNDIFPDKQFSTMQNVIENLTSKDIDKLFKIINEKTDIVKIKTSDIKILAPIDKPRHDILCVGVNYAAHLKEAQDRVVNFHKDEKAIYFGKRAIKILGSGEKLISRLDIDEALDYEVELAVIIGKTGKDIAPEDAEDYIFGYSVFNDFSSRHLQKDHVQWFKGKSLDTYTAMGPVILYKSALPFPVETDIKCYVNGELRQNSNTRLFLTKIPQIIADLSAGMTLEAGDIIATGTPSGVGMGYKPGKWLKKGDSVVCEIPAIGKLINTIA